MCGRYAIHITPEEVQAWFGESITSQTTPQTWNAAPGQALPVIKTKDRPVLESLIWGLIPHWAQNAEHKKGIMNARFESIHEKPAFKNLIPRQRCIVPASGFFEWKKEGAEKKPYYIHFPEFPIFAMAGLWDAYQPTEGTIIETFTIITIPANDSIRPLHDRMPLILNPENANSWLSKGHLSEIQTQISQWPLTLKTELYPVSQKVNAVRNDGPELIFPLSGGAQISLFE